MLQRIEPPPIFRKFEHELQCGGGSGDGGGFIPTLVGVDVPIPY
jgi:hypothetical protein